jgi:hypothetical protein
MKICGIPRKGRLFEKQVYEPPMHADGTQVFHRRPSAFIGGSNETQPPVANNSLLARPECSRITYRHVGAAANGE